MLSIKKDGIAEAQRWHRIVSNKKINLKKTKYIILPPDILKKECVVVEPESKYFVRQINNNDMI